jgi:hypothetical protein
MGNVWRKYIISYNVWILLVIACWPLGQWSLFVGDVEWPPVAARDWYPRQIMRLALPTTKGGSEVRFWCFWCFSVYLYWDCDCVAAWRGAVGCHGLCCLDGPPFPRFLLAHAVYCHICSGTW